MFHLVHDPSDGNQFLAAVNNILSGPEIQVSADLGLTWSGVAEQPRFVDHDDLVVKRLWHIEPGTAEEPGVFYAGVEPAVLFKSEDGASTW